MPAMNLFTVDGLPLVRPGDDIASLIVERLAAAHEQLQPGDIVVIAQKIVSKSEGRIVRLRDVVPGEHARELAEVVDKDPRVVQVVLDESRSVLRARRGLLVVEQNSGWICANAGVDRSNVDAANQTHDDDEALLTLLPADADASAEALRARFAELTGVAPAVLIIDSHGRAWRIGTTGVSIGCAGMPPLWDQRGLHDLYGYELVASEECIADELAAAASLLMGQSDEGRPVVIIRGYKLPDKPPAPARSIQRPAHQDAFR
jgi:coenzyme F420-0:L-glutamate ligase/coenzyme F420-1:gamma-L-glutamate ligase